MKLHDLISAALPDVKLSSDQGSRDILDVTDDSRNIKPESLFVAVPGFHADGHRFIPQAIRAGAAAIIAEEGKATGADSGIPIIRVADSRAALAAVADAFYDHPSRKLKLIGITGTNGKTTTSYLVKSIIESADQRTGLIGTIDYRIGDRVYPAPNTTPESLDLQKLLAEMIRQGAGYCVMEVSSHALALGRVAYCTFAAAAFTNLTQDHLDFHRDMESYFESKLRLFTGLSSDNVAIINSDDPAGARIMKGTTAHVITFGLSDKAAVHPVGRITHDIHGLSFSVTTPDGPVEIESPLMGRHNIYNILTAVGVGTALGFSAVSIARGIRDMKAVPGRMEKVDEGQSFGVIVDYAHTEDALIRLLEAVREIASGKVITVFGCGGDRDRTKRPKMGTAALGGSDIVVVTSDNPRSEDPLEIIREIESGMADSGARVSESGLSLPTNGKKPYLVIPDRAEAIETAISIAGPGDIVVLAGKGHEDYQIIGNTKSSFDDRKVARSAIRKIMDAGCRMQDAR